MFSFDILSFRVLLLNYYRSAIIRSTTSDAFSFDVISDVLSFGVLSFICSLAIYYLLRTQTFVAHQDFNTRTMMSVLFILDPYLKSIFAIPIVITIAVADEYIWRLPFLLLA